MDFGIPAYEYVTTLLAALAAPMAGVQIVRWILPQERRLLVDWLQYVLERRFSAAGPLERELAASVRIGP